MTTEADPHTAPEQRAHAPGKPKSWQVTEGAERAPNRSYFYAMGLTDDDLKKPIVAVGHAGNEAMPCNIHLGGLVIDAPMGTPVAAVSAGRVRFAGWFRGYGRIVILDHADNWFTVSGHLDELDVALGDEVKARQTLGRVGETGSLTGSQLYFEIRRGAEAQNPADWLR